MDTTWLDRITVEGELEDATAADAALVQAAIELAHAEADLERAGFFALARRGRPSARAIGRTRRSCATGATATSSASPTSDRGVTGSRSTATSSRSASKPSRPTSVGSTRRPSRRTLVSRQGGDLLVEVDHVPHRIARDDGGIVRSRGPGVVVALPGRPGETVEAGDVVAVIESMKMAMSLTAPVGGRIRELLVGTNVQVGSSQPLVAIELAGEQAQGDERDRVVFTADAAWEPEPARRCEVNLERLEWLALGYDVSAAEVRRAIEDMEGVCADVAACGPGLVDGEHRLLGLYADVKALDRPRHESSEAEEELLRSPQEHFHAFLRSFDAEAEGLPPHFVELLERALAHYGVTDLDRTEELELACYRIALAQQRSSLARDAVIAILDRRLERSEELLGENGPELRDVLDRLESAMEGRDPVVADLAREVRYRFYHQPPVAAARDRLYAEMDDHLDALTENPAASGGQERIDALVRCPQPLAPKLALLMADAPAAARGVLLEVTTRRFFRLHELEPFTARRVGGLDWALSGYEHGGTSHHLAAAFIELDHLDRAVAALAEHATTFPAGETVVAELYARAGEIDHDELSNVLQRALQATPVPASVGRIVLAAAAPEHGSGMSAVGMLTLRRDADSGWEEEVELRDLHPEMAERLELWRFSEFVLERLPSPEDVYFFSGKARSNPADERLFVMAEVRDLTAIRDERGEITALPEIERMYGEVLEAMRAFQAHRPTAKRLLWNRVLLFCWPVIEIGTAEHPPTRCPLRAGRRRARD